MTEIWKDIDEYDGVYQVSSFGSIRNTGIGISSAKILKPHLGTTGYYYVNLSKKSKVKLHKIHRTVARHFLTFNTAKNIVNHIDGNKLNNYVSNLEWCTSTENNRHARVLGLAVDVKGEQCGKSKFSNKEVLLMRSLCPDDWTAQHLKTLAIQFNTSHQNVRAIINRQAWKHI